MGFDHVELALFGKWFPERPPLRPPNGQHFEKWFFDTVGGEEGYRMCPRDPPCNRGSPDLEFGPAGRLASHDLDR